MPGAPHRCEMCGTVVPPWAELSYPRIGSGAQSRVLRGPQHCAECGRLGCPTCLRVVEERVDDFFIDEPTCLPCLRRARPGGP